MHNEPVDTFGTRLRGLGDAAGLTQEQLAERAGLSANAIGALERGERRRPYPHTLQALADALGLGEAERTALADTVALADRGSSSPEPDLGASLPTPPTHLVGREQEVATLVERLTGSASRLVTLTGPGGVGKTRLALAVAADTAGAFPHGVAFVSLAPLANPALVVPTIAGTLGLRESGGRDLREALRAYLRPRRMLLVLDNFEHVLAAALEVAELLAACPELRVLVTSRAPLHLRGEQEVPVAPLELPDLARVPTVAEVAETAAARLFVERAREVAPAFQLTQVNAAAVAAICRRLDGLPLAIELAAAWIKVLPPVELLTRLDRALPLLAGGAWDLPGRQRTMEHTIAWSHDLLSPAERVLFRRLAVFAGGFTLEAAEAVVSSPGDLGVEVLEGVASLVDKSLLRQTEGVGGDARFGMLETVRQYGWERLAESGEEDAVRRPHMAWCVRLVERAEEAFLSAEEPTWLDRLEAEHDNLRTALAWTIEHRDVESALRLAGAPWWFWAMRGFLGQGSSWLEQALALPDGEATVARAKAIIAAGMVAWARGEVDRSDDRLQQSLALWRSMGDGARLARSLHYLGLVAWQRGDFRAMAARAQESLATAEEADDEVEKAVARVTLGAALLRLGERDRARQALAQALERFRAEGMRRTTAWALSHLAEVAQLDGDRRRAFDLHLEALGVYREIRDTWGVGAELPDLAALAAASGHQEAAARLLGAAARMQETTGIATQNRLSNAEQVAGQLRAHLGERPFADAWGAGRSLSVEQVAAEAEAISAALASGAQSSPSPATRLTYPAGLSAREVEVLRLVAQGLTNPQVAERLFISPRTVDAHMLRIYAKLDVPNRGAAIRFAIQHGLS